MVAVSFSGLFHTLGDASGFIFPNEQVITWRLLVVLYPFLAGIVSGSFILAFLVRVFKVEVLRPVYRLSMLVALAFMLVAPWPLLLHLGHPERGIQIFITPSTSSPMAAFGFVYLWLFLCVNLGLWFEYRKYFVLWANEQTGLKATVYRLLTLGVRDTSADAVALDDRLSKLFSLIGFPAALILPGYVGFIFFSMKANPMWGNWMLPVIFVFSAMVSGLALCLALYVLLNWVDKRPLNPACLGAMGRLLFVVLLLTACFEAYDWYVRIASIGENIPVIQELALGELFVPLIVLQGCLGTLLPLILLGAALLRQSGQLRPAILMVSSVLVLLGILAMRWNVVIGGQLVSKSLRGLSSFSVEWFGQGGLALSIAFLLLPFLILGLFIRLLLPDELHASSVF